MDGPVSWVDTDGNTEIRSSAGDTLQILYKVKNRTF